MPYLLDADVLIEGKKRWFGFDFCPGFWDWIDAAHAAGVVRSVEAVRTEVLAGDDELVEWVNDRRHLFVAPDEAVVSAFGELVDWAYSSSVYEDVAKATFASAADAWLLAQARVSGEVVVTHEVANNSAKQIKIPEVAAAFGVQVMNSFDLLRTERVRLVLRAT